MKFKSFETLVKRFIINDLLEYLRINKSQYDTFLREFRIVTYSHRTEPDLSITLDAYASYNSIIKGLQELARGIFDYLNKVGIINSLNKYDIWILPETVYSLKIYIPVKDIFRVLNLSENEVVCYD